MRKIFFILSLFAVFSFSAIWGFTSAANGSLPPAPPPAPSATPPASQQNFLIIQVDDLSAPEPKLISLWIGSDFKSANQTVLTYSAITARDSAASADKMKNSFKLTADGTPSAQFFHAVSAARLQWRGYLLLDETGLLQVDQWLAAQGVPAEMQASSAAQAVLLRSCAYLSAGGVQQPSPFAWDQFDAHFQTDLPFDTLMVLWNGLLDPARPARCEVISE